MKKLKRRSDWLAACLFLGPNLTGFLVFVALPVIFSIIMAFTNWDLSLHNRYRDDAIQWVWFRNFYDLFTHRDFWKYFGNTLFLMLGIPVGIAGALFLAVLLTRPLRSKRKSIRWILAMISLAGFSMLGLGLWLNGYGVVAVIFCLMAGGILAMGVTTGATVYRTLFYLPNFCSGVAIYLLWKHMYNPHRGPINLALQPMLDKLANLVNSTPAWWWVWGGYGLWVIAVAGALWLSALVLRNWLGGECGFGTAFMSLTVLAASGLVLYGLGIVSQSLPTMATDGLLAPNWLNKVHWAKPAIMIMGVWGAIGGGSMLLYIAGISNIPQDLYEAADIDGAGSWQRFWYITWPQLAPTTFFIVIMAFIGGIQGGFETARTMTDGGPFGATTTLSYYVYLEGFETGRLGYASAVAWAMFAIIFTITVFNYKVGSRYTSE